LKSAIKHSQTEMVLFSLSIMSLTFFCLLPLFFHYCTLKRGCDLTDVLATRRFALLVKSLQWKRKIQCGNSCGRMLTLFELFGAVFLFIWCGNPVPTPLL